VQLEGLRVLGDPREFAIEYYNAGIDELLYMDIVASLYGRNNLLTTVERTAEEVFVPLTVGGGIRSLSDVRAILNSGADKVAVNTAAIRNPRLIREIADTFGSQCVVLSVEAKRQQSGEWEAYTDNGRERTGRSVIEWISQATRNGVGEVLITSVDREGTRRGLDLDLLKRVHEVTNIPVIISGGFREPRNFSEAISAGADAVAVADALHFRRFSIDEIRSQSELTSS
jgi:cyclase